jgi:lysophospholipase L1-like esterase
MRDVVRVLMVLLVAVGWMRHPAGAETALVEPEDDHAVNRVACVGDSITAGVGVKNMTLEAYPVQLDNMLGGKWNVRNFGVSGATMLNKGDLPYSKQKACQAALTFNPDVVVIMLGTNDSKPQNWRYKEEFGADAKGLIARFAALPSKPRIFIAHPVPVARENFGINDSGVKEEQPMIDAVARETGATVIDLYSPLVRRPDCFPDGVHPNAAGASIMAQAVYKALMGQEYDGPLPPSPKAKATPVK